MWPHKEVVDPWHVAVKRGTDRIKNPRDAVHPLAVVPRQGSAALPVSMKRGLRCNASLYPSAPDEVAQGGHGAHRQPVGNHPRKREFVEMIRFVQIQQAGKPSGGGGGQATGIGVSCEGVQFVLLSLVYHMTSRLSIT